ncbi:hypothetical protein P154DRAFT_459229 [Amniculicola lignicola CBS 123094]|uniref:Derlin n=1 Tax=Amniculicola lignicola CBS 123094 TaxID=1392246 RepID=A0A6A5WUX6_9PLEO|nr:hypothetical protein P154DRAFT_459229 [Amniculicola lignicola CBS 123094]
MDVFWALPPVSRTITAGAVVVSALGYSGMIDLSSYVFAQRYLVTLKTVPQLWRLVTPFLITKPKFSILLDPYFLYQYGSGLETESTRFSQPGDFFIYTAFICAVVVRHIAVTVPGIEEDYPCTVHSPVIRKKLRGCGGVTMLAQNYILSSPSLSMSIVNLPNLKATAGFMLQSAIFLQALSLAFAYTYAQDNPTRQVSFFIITFDAKYLPFAMLFLTFIIDGPGSAMTQATGLVAAHLFDFLTRIWPTFGGGRNYIFTPMVVKRWFGARPGAAQARGYGTAFQGRGNEADNATRAPGFNQRGPGRRLGD